MLFADVNKILADKNVSLSEYTPKGGESMEFVGERFFSFFQDLCQSVYDKHTNTSPSADGNISSPSAGKKEVCCQPLAAEEAKEEAIAEAILLVSHGGALRQFYKVLRTTNACHFPCEIFVSPRNTAFTVFTVK